MFHICLSYDNLDMAISGQKKQLEYPISMLSIDAENSSEDQVI